MLWYKDRKNFRSWLKKFNNPLSFTEYVAYGLAIFAVGFAVGYTYQTLVNVIHRYCVW